MKTVQEYLNIIDIESLVNIFYDRIKNIIFDSESYKDMTIQEIEIYSKNKIRNFIYKLQNLEVQKAEHEYVLVAYEGYFDNTMTEPLFSLIRFDELMKIEKIDSDEEFNKIESYAYEFSPQTEIVGYKISDNEYTQKNIYELLSDVLFEASFFGYEEDDKKEELAKLEEAVKEVEEYKNGEKDLATHAFDFDEWADKLDIYRPDETEKIINKKVMDSIIEYNKYSFIKEMKKIWNQIKREDETYE